MNIHKSAHISLELSRNPIWHFKAIICNIGTNTAKHVKLIFSKSISIFISMFAHL